ncbi:MAG: hypothetical protein U9R75_03175 [Candidatus Thermoplasmatota archaeon]|nr:hypothetical protein [Candidatus Thermoplasmatota archaeon]
MEAIPGVVLYISIILGASLAAGTAMEISEEISVEGETIVDDTVSLILTRLDIISIHGMVSNESIEELMFTVRPSTGCDLIDLNRTLVEIKCSDNVTTLEYGEDNGFNFTVLRDTKGDLKNGTLRSGDLIRITAEHRVHAGDRLEVTFHLFPNGVTRTSFTVPDILLDNLVTIR